MSTQPPKTSTAVTYSPKLNLNSSGKYNKPFFGKLIEQKNIEAQNKFNSWNALPDNDAKYRSGITAGYINKADYDNYVKQKTAIDAWNALPNNEIKYKKGVEAGYIEQADYNSYIQRKADVASWNAMPDGLEKAKLGLEKGYVSTVDYNSYANAIEQNTQKTKEFNTWKALPDGDAKYKAGVDAGYINRADYDAYLVNKNKIDTWNAMPNSDEKYRLGVDAGYVNKVDYDLYLTNKASIDTWNAMPTGLKKAKLGLEKGYLTDAEYKSYTRKLERAREERAEVRAYNANVATFNAMTDTKERLKFGLDNKILDQTQYDGMMMREGMYDKFNAMTNISEKLQYGVSAGILTEQDAKDFIIKQSNKGTIYTQAQSTFDFMPSTTKEEYLAKVEYGFKNDLITKEKRAEYINAVQTENLHPSPIERAQTDAE